MNTKPVKKRDLYNGGRGSDPNDFEMDSDNTTSPPTSPCGSGPSSLISYDSPLSPPATPDFPTSLSTAQGPALYPAVLHNFSMHSSPYFSHHPQAPTVYVPGAYPLASYNPNNPVSSVTNAHFPDPRIYQNRLNSRFADFTRSRDPDNDMPTSEGSSSNTPTRHQKCSLCFNHGIVVEKKGHKWQCMHKSCKCSRCIITKDRQKTMRDQQKLSRHLHKMHL